LAYSRSSSRSSVANPVRRRKIRSKRARRRPPTGGGGAAVGFEIGVEPPDQGAQALLSGVPLVGEGVELVDQALGMDPAQGVVIDRELPGVVGQHHGVGQQPMSLDRAPWCAFGGDADRVGRDLQVGDAEPPEVIQPRRLIGEVPVGMVGQGGDDRPGRAGACWPAPRS
jgi:hypothetical protein